MRKQTTVPVGPYSIVEIVYLFLGSRAGDQLICSIGIQTSVSVLDTNIVLNDLRSALKSERPTALQIAAHLGAVRCFAATRVRDEVEEKIDTLAPAWQWDPLQARDVWRRDYQFIRFIDPEGIPLRSRRVAELMARDPDDVPTAQLIELIKPDVNFPLDRHLHTFGPVASRPIRHLLRR